MTEKRFMVDDCGTLIDMRTRNTFDYVSDVVELLNGLAEENKELKSILQDMGLIMSDEEVKNVRDEIASKLIKPVCKGNGFDVDVNTENGFTIIPKEVNND